MDAALVLIVIAALVAGSTALGLLYRHLRGRARRASTERIVAIDGLELGERATLLQFSTQFCAPCVSTARVLEGVARRHPGTSHVEIDVTDRPDLAAEFALFQTPTTLVLDARGVLRARIGGAVRPDVVVAELANVLGAPAGAAPAGAAPAEPSPSRHPQIG